MTNLYSFQFCQKIVIFSLSLDKVLLCKRKGEQDLDGIYTFIGGKLETTDAGIIDGMKREKTEEIGEAAKVKLFPKFSTNYIFKKKDGNIMILPHYFAIFESGTITINSEYSDYQWVSLDDLGKFEPKVENITEITFALKNLATSLKLKDEDFTLI